MKKVFVFMFVVFLINSVNATTINEIMYNPEGSDNNWEFIEVYSEDWVNLTDYVIEDSSSNDTLKLVYFYNSSYSLIVEDDFNFIGINATIYSAGATIGNNLNNDGDSVILKLGNGSVIDYVNYTSSVGGSNNGKTICILSDENRTFYECEPTPGAENVAVVKNETENKTANVKLGVHLQNITVLNVLYNSLFKIEIENKDNCSIKDNISVYYNITNASGILVKEGNFTREVGCSGYADTGEWMPDETGNFTLCGLITNSSVNDTDDFACKNVTVIDTSVISCDLSLAIKTENLVYNASEKLEYIVEINDTNCSQMTHPFMIEHWIEDLYGNIIKNPDSSEPEITCTKTKTYQWTPDNMIGSEAYVIKANITKPYCNDTKSDNNFNSKIIIVKGNLSSSQITNSSLNIIEIKTGSDNKVKYGESFDVKLEIYRGDTNKYAIYLWVENSEGKKLSEKTTIHAKGKYTNYKLVVPVQVKTNCNQKYPDGVYSLVVEGLDLSERGQITIEGLSSSACKTEYKTKSGGYYIPKSEEQTVSPIYTILSYPETVYKGEEFEMELKLRNDGNTPKELSVYSYVYESKRPLSEGFDGETWKGSWTANKQEVVIKAGENLILVLKNKIKEDVDVGEYTLKARIKEGKRETDLTKKINVLEQRKSQYNLILSCEVIENKTVVVIENKGLNNIIDTKLLIFSAKNIESHGVSINGKEKKFFVFKPEPETTHHYLLVKDYLILGNCSAEYEKNNFFNRITGKTLTSGNGVINWFASLFRKVFG